MPDKRKPNPDHKRIAFSYGVKARCSCGWESSIWLGKGARLNANGEWRMHRDKCEKQTQQKEPNK